MVADDGDDRQRRLVLDLQRPGRGEHGAEHEGATSARTVEEPGDDVHGSEDRRIHMDSSEKRWIVSKIRVSLVRMNDTISGWVRVVTIVAATGAGVMGGVYAAFSTIVMPALRRLPADRAVAAMQAMNRTAPAPWVVLGLLGAGGACTALAVQALGDLGDVGARWRLVGSGLYLSSVVDHVRRSTSPATRRSTGSTPPDAGAGAAWEDVRRQLDGRQPRPGADVRSPPPPCWRTR